MWLWMAGRILVGLGGSRGRVEVGRRRWVLEEVAGMVGGEAVVVGVEGGGDVVGGPES